MKNYTKLILSLILFAGLTSGLIASDRSIVKFGDDVTVEKDMRVEDAVSIGGSVYVDGIVDGDAVAVGGSIHLSEEAIVHGDAVTVGGSIDEAEGAKIYGSTVDVSNIDIDKLFAGKHFFNGKHSLPWGLKFIPLIGLLALVLLLAVIIPKELNKVANYIRNEPLKMFLYGVLGVILIIPLIVMLAISIIGLALIPIAILAIILAIVIGYVAVAIIIGKKILKALNNEAPSILLSAVLGILVLWLVGFIPFIGSIVIVIATIFGFGAVIIAVARRNKKNSEEVIIVDPEPVEAVAGKEA